MTNRPSFEVGEPTGWVVTEAAELVTEEMIEAADAAAWDAGIAVFHRDAIRVVLRAVAPLIAARAMAEPMVGAMATIRAAEIADRHFKMALRAAVAAEREACAKIMDAIADEYVDDGGPAREGAAAIRARGNAPERRGE